MSENQIRDDEVAAILADQPLPETPDGFWADLRSTMETTAPNTGPAVAPDPPSSDDADVVVPMETQRDSTRLGAPAARLMVAAGLLLIVGVVAAFALLNRDSGTETGPAEPPGPDVDVTPAPDPTPTPDQTPADPPEPSVDTVPADEGTIPTTLVIPLLRDHFGDRIEVQGFCTDIGRVDELVGLCVSAAVEPPNVFELGGPLTSAIFRVRVASVDGEWVVVDEEDRTPNGAQPSGPDVPTEEALRLFRERIPEAEVGGLCADVGFDCIFPVPEFGTNAFEYAIGYDPSGFILRFAEGSAGWEVNEEIDRGNVFAACDASPPPGDATEVVGFDTIDGELVDVGIDIDGNTSRDRIVTWVEGSTTFVQAWGDDTVRSPAWAAPEGYELSGTDSDDGLADQEFLVFEHADGERLGKQLDGCTWVDVAVP